MRRWISLHAPLWSETKFRQHFLRCSPDTHPRRESVYPKNKWEVVPKVYPRSEQNKETNTSTHIRAVQIRGHTWAPMTQYGSAHYSSAGLRSVGFDSDSSLWCHPISIKPANCQRAAPRPPKATRHNTLGLI